MDQYGTTPPSPGSPTPGSGGYPGQAMSGPIHAAPAPPSPHVLHVVARPGALSWALGWLIGAVAIGVIFLAGLVFGVIFMVAGSSLDRMVLERPYRTGSSGSSIAVIPVIDFIDGQQASFVHSCVDRAIKDSSVVGVVLRVDSPGGMVSPSDRIWNEVQRLKQSRLPVVASFGGVAASGGYYVSCGADSIFAEETCITGSIGVIANVLTLEGLMQKVGIEPVTIVASGSPEKNTANDIFRAWTDHDKAKVRTMLDAAYDVFRRRVTDGRKNTIDATMLDAITDGSIFTATQAKANGLVDAIGYLDDAIAKAEAMAGLGAGQANVVLYQPPPSLFSSGVLIHERAGGDASPWTAERIRALANDLASPRVMYLMR